MVGLGLGGMDLVGAGGLSQIVGYVASGVAPVLVYDFETGQVGPLVAARASTATYVDADGLIRVAGVDQQRFDWSTGRRALLLEESATNLVLWSGEIVVPRWTLQNTSTEPATGPNNSSGAYRIIPTSGSTGNQRAKTPSMSAVVGQTYTVSFWLRGTGCRYLSVAGPVVGLVTGVVLDTQAGTVVSAPGYASARVEKVLPSGWMRVVITASATSIGPDGVNFWACNNAGAFTFAGDGIAGFELAMPQVEVGPTATSYIPTAGSAVTRAADFAAPIDLTGYDLSGGYTVVAWGQLDGVVGSFDRVLQLDTGSEANRHVTFWDRSAGILGMRVVASDVLQGDFALTGGPQLGQQFKVAMSVGSNNFLAARNGAVSALDTSVTYVTPTALRLGKAIASGKPARLLLSRVALYPKLLAADDLMGVTL